MKMLSSVLCVFALAVLLAGCTSSQPSAQPTAVPTAVVQSTATPVPTGAPSGGVKEFTIEASEFKFTPSTISVNQGDSVRINFTNAGLYPHSFSIDEFGVSGSILAPNGSEVIEFIASRAGSFTFYCAVPSHRERGMNGTLIVS